MKLRSRLLVLTISTLLPMIVLTAIASALFAQRERATFRRGATERTLALLTALDTELKGSIMTLQASRFLVVPAQDLRDFVLRNPKFALSLIEKLIQRVRVLTESVKSLAFMDVYGRVARLLLELAEEQDGRLVIGERLTQQEIASRVGASREMVSRILKDLSLCGCLTHSRSGIVLHRKPPARW